MYWQNTWYRQDFYPVWMVDTREALELIKQAVQGERNDELFYDELISLAPTAAQKEIIASIRNDERQHNQMFRGIYKALTGRDITGISDEQYKKITSYMDGLQQALFGELSAIEKYRKIWFGLPIGIYKDTVLGIILDEQKHASKYNYLITINSTVGYIEQKEGRL